MNKQSDVSDLSENKLGLSQTPSGWEFRVWSPVAEQMRLKFYATGVNGEMIAQHDMTKIDDVWSIKLKQVENQFYAFQAKIDGQWMQEVVDPYVKLVGVNGHRGYVGLPSVANPSDWQLDKRPIFEAPTDWVIYELNVRDLSMDASSNIDNKGKFLGFTEQGTKNNSGDATGLDHLKELGITHVHLLPSFDFRSIDETKLYENKFNWGYDPQNYNVPEGSFSTDPFDPMSRVQEFKQLVQSLHANGIGVILDVVYNHTGFTETSLFNQLVPNYYYRLNEDGSFSNASACGNETASEKKMMRKFMIESMVYWAEEYHLDGFRVDLMGIHDIETMNLITEALKAVYKDIFVYGEGWTASSSPLPDSLRAIKSNTQLLDNIAAFSDEFRDGVKGHWAEKTDKGFVSGKEGLKESIKFGIVASTKHQQVDYTKVNYADAPWAREPWQHMSYVSCHDDLTLWDKLKVSNPDEPDAELVKMHKLANTMVMTSQGVPFLHGGVDFLRSKNGDHNSFESPDEINSIKWDQKTVNKDVFRYYQELIRLRKQHPAFRMSSTVDIQHHLRFIDTSSDLLVGFQLSDNANGDSWKDIIVYFNGSKDSATIDLPEGNWTVTANNHQIALNGLEEADGQLTMAGRSAFIAFRQ
ncbi:MAG: type I pullulanase [Cyclobacteriaceae bacterium]